MVEGGFEGDSAAGMALDQRDEELGRGVVDAAMVYDDSVGFDGVKNAVSVDSTLPSPSGQPAAVCLATLGCGSRFR